MKITTILSIALMATAITSCGQQPIVYQQAPMAQQQYVDPSQQQQADPNYDNGSYDSYYGSNGQQYAVTQIDGVQRYILMATFLHYMNQGGYGSVYGYYRQYPTYFPTYSSSLGWRHYGSPVVYRNYYSSHHVQPIRVQRTNTVNSPVVHTVKSVPPAPPHPQQQQSAPKYNISAPTKSVFAGAPMRQQSSYRSATITRSAPSSSRSMSSGGGHSHHR